MSSCVYGKKAVLEAINNGTLKSVYTIHGNEFVKKIDKKIEIVYQDKSFFKQYEKINHQNLIGVLKNKEKLKIHSDVKEFLNSFNLKTNQLVLFLDEIQDPGNFGAICRTASALGVDGIVYKKNNQVELNETVIKTSVGAVYNLNFLKTSNLVNILENFKKEGFWILCSSLTEKSMALNKFKTKFDKVVLIVGNEENGVSSLLQKKSDVILNIPMENNVQSLNVSVATGILLHYIKNLT